MSKQTKMLGIVALMMILSGCTTPVLPVLPKAPMELMTQAHPVQPLRKGMTNSEALGVMTDNNALHVQCVRRVAGWQTFYQELQAQ